MQKNRNTHWNKPENRENEGEKQKWEKKLSFGMIFLAINTLEKSWSKLLVINKECVPLLCINTQK